jgi:hypothetical protein
VRVRLPDPDPPILAAGLEAWATAGFRPRDHVNHLLERRPAPDEPLPMPESPHLLVFEDPPSAVAVPPER